MKRQDKTTEIFPYVQPSRAGERATEKSSFAIPASNKQIIERLTDKPTDTRIDRLTHKHTDRINCIHDTTPYTLASMRKSKSVREEKRKNAQTHAPRLDYWYARDLPWIGEIQEQDKFWPERSRQEWLVQDSVGTKTKKDHHVLCDTQNVGSSSGFHSWLWH